MRYRIKAHLIEAITLSRHSGPDIVLEGDDGFRYEFVTDARGLEILELAISGSIDPSTHGTELRPSGRADVNYDVQWNPDPQMRNQLLEAFRVLESSLTFIAGAVAGVDWSGAVEELIPESEEERGLLAVTSFALARKRPSNNPAISPSMIRALVEEKLPFVLEGLYANHKSSEKEVLRQFAKSSELAIATERALSALAKEYPRHLNRVSTTASLDLKG